MKKGMGFTIVELLIVVFIIGVLSTFVFLQYGESQARALDSQRISDLNKIKYAMISYRQDHGRLPQCGSDSNGPTLYCLISKESIVNQLKPYIDPIPRDPKPVGAFTEYEYYEPHKNSSTNIYHPGILITQLNDISIKGDINPIHSAEVGNIRNCIDYAYCITVE